jgi:hypothetical protein
MGKLWILTGDLEAAGWQTLRQDYKDEKVDIIHLDPKVWAIVAAETPPSGYDGLSAETPQDGLYVDPNGSPLYLVGGEVVDGPQKVIDALGPAARDMMKTVSDPNTVLERLGRAF